MPSYTITLTDEQDKAFRYVAVDPQEWLQNLADSRAEKATAEIVQIEVARMMEDPSITDIPADSNQIVRNSNLPSAAERNRMAEERGGPPE